MLDLTQEQEQKAAELHQSSIVVDSLLSWPFCMSRESADRLNQMESDGAEIIDLIYASNDSWSDPAERRLLDGELPELWEFWDKSGITAASHTIGVFGPDGAWSFGQAIRDCAKWQRRFDAVDKFQKVTKAADILAAKENGSLGIILNFQNAVCIGDKLDNVNLFYDFGVRVMQLTYNTRNLLADGCLEREPAGMSKYGQKVVRRMNELGMVIDVSHSSEKTTLDAISFSDSPVAVTHSACKAIFDHPRNKSDQVLEAVAENNGYFGILYCPFFLAASNSSINDWIKHVNHAVSIAGVDHVGICSDWARMPKPLADRFHIFAEKEFEFEGDHAIPKHAVTQGLEDYDQFGNITRALVAEGYSDDEIRAILGGNWLRLFSRVCG